MNPLGINLWNWVNELGPGCAGLPEKIRAMGFTAIELPMSQPEPDEALMAEVRSSGLRVSLCAAMGPGRDMSSFDPEVRRRSLDYLTACLKTAERLDCHILAGPLYAGGGKRHLLPESEREREWALAVESVSTLARRAAERGVRLALEPLNRYRTSVVNTAEQCLRMVRDIGMDNVGVHFDTYQAGIEEEDLVGALKNVSDVGKLYHVHACANNRGGPGRGFFPWADIWAVVKACGYSGHITMETFAPGGLDSGWTQPDGTPDEAARRGIRYLQSVFEKGT